MKINERKKPQNGLYGFASHNSGDGGGEGGDGDVCDATSPVSPAVLNASRYYYNTRPTPEERKIFIRFPGTIVDFALGDFPT